MEQKKISVIMPCTLSSYHGAAGERAIKLNRAIQSFLNQDYERKQLLIISDGCQATLDFVKGNYFNHPNITCMFIEKQELFSGSVREMGLKIADGEIISYLDSDDTLKSNHLTNIVNAFNSNTECDWFYFDDYIKYFQLDHLPIERRNVELTQGSIGTSNIAHKNLPGISWEGCTGYGHDYTFITRMMTLYPNYKKIDGCGYVVCHIPNSFES